MFYARCGPTIAIDTLDFKKRVTRIGGHFKYLNSVTGENSYGCKITNQWIPTKEEYEILGRHERGKINNDVVEIMFIDCKFLEMPQGLTKIFPNLKNLSILNSDLKFLDQDDLAEYKDLRRIICCGNPIEYLPGDLFDGFENLEWIAFYNNKLRTIEPNILDGHKNLKVVNFINNPNFDKCFSVYPEYRSNATLQEIKNELIEKFRKPDQDELNQEIAHFNDNSIFTDLMAHIKNESFKDFKIELDGREFHVHKFLLAIRSTTIADILRKNPDAKMLKLIDIPVETFKLILNFLYTDNLPFDNETNFRHIFAAASRLGIEKLRNFAALKILDKTKPENFCELLDLSNIYGHNDLRQKVFEEVKKIYPGIKFKDEWAYEIGKVSKVIELFMKKEDRKQQIDKDFEKLLI